MALVPLKCPNCGGEIQIDGSFKYGFCIYCGTKIMNEPQGTDNNRDTELINLLKLAKLSIASQDLRAADATLEKAMLVDVDVSDLWCMKAVVDWDVGNKRAGHFARADACSRSLGIFTKDDASKQHGVPVTFFFQSKSLMTPDIMALLYFDNGMEIFVPIKKTNTVNISEGEHSVLLKSLTRKRAGNSSFTEQNEILNISGPCTFILTLKDDKSGFNIVTKNES